MPNRFTYPIVLAPDKEDGGYLVTFPDIDWAVTQGDSIEDCLAMADDCLEECLACCIADGQPIPEPSALGPATYSATPGARIALKAAVYLAWKEADISKTALAERLDVKEGEARRILDPRHNTRLETLERALQSLGKRVRVVIEDMRGAA